MDNPAPYIVEEHGDEAEKTEELSEEEVVAGFEFEEEQEAEEYPEDVPMFKQKRLDDK